MAIGMFSMQQIMSKLTATPQPPNPPPKNYRPLSALPKTSPTPAHTTYSKSNPISEMDNILLYAYLD